MVRLVLLLWVVVAFFYFFLSYDSIRSSMTDKDFGDYLSYVVQIAGDQHRPQKEIRALILVRSEALGLPIQGAQIAVIGAGETLNISVEYVVDIEVPSFARGIYQKVYQHKVSYAVQR